jgi:hypothetical protein
MEEILKLRRWEQGKKINFGRLLSFISEVRDFQKELECGKVFPSAYLGTYARHKDKNYILVIDMVKQVFPVYENKPVVHAQIIMGRNQVILRLKDYNDKNRIKQEIVWDSDEKVLKVVIGLLEIFKEAGIIPILTPDRYFGTYLVEYQTSFDDTFEMLGDTELVEIGEILGEVGFECNGTGYVKQFGGFTINISHRNIYKDCIVSLTDGNDSSNIHWAIKKEKLMQFMQEIDVKHELWLDKKTKSD